MRFPTSAVVAAAATSALLAVSACSVDETGTASQKKDDSAATTSDRSWNDGGKVTIPVPEEDSAKDWRILFTGYGQDNALANAFAAAVQSEAELYGGTAEFAGPTTADADAQSKLVCDAATSGRYQAIVIQAIDSANITPCIKQALDAGLKVATVQYPIGPDVTSTEIQVPGVTTQILGDIVEVAEAQADAAIEQCEGVDPCEVGILWGARSFPIDAVKVEPTLKALGAHDNIKIVCQSDANYQETLGKEQAADCLSAHPKLNVLISGSDESSHGAESAITDAGRTFGLNKGDVKIVSSYARKYGVKQIMDGKWVMSTFMRPNADGRAAVDLLLVERKGGDVPSYVNSADLDAIGLVVEQSTGEKVPDIIDRAY